MLLRTRTHDLGSSGFRIYERARRAGWRPTDSIDWNRPTALSPQQQELAWIIASQGSYAEQVGLLAAARLLGETEDLASRLCLATAVSDEAKHSEVFARYALSRGGRVAPPQHAVEKLHRGMEEIDDFLGRFFVHTVLEWGAADEFSIFVKAFEGDALGEIYALVRTDETRHVAMGMDYLSKRLREPGRDPGWDLARYEKLALELSGMNDPFFEWLSGLAGTSPAELRRWFMTRHERRIRRIQKAVVNPTKGGAHHEEDEDP